MLMPHLKAWEFLLAINQSKNEILKHYSGDVHEKSDKGSPNLQMALFDELLCIFQSLTSSALWLQVFTGL